MRRRFRLPSSDDDEDETPNPNPPTPPNPDPIVLSSSSSSSDDGFVDAPASFSPPAPGSSPASAEVDAFLRNLGLRLRREWIDSCVAGLGGSGSRLDVAGKGRICFERFLVADMNGCGAGVLPENVVGLHGVELPGPFVLQVDEMVNISSPLRDRYSNAPAGLKRCLKLSLTDGVQCVCGMEYRPIKDLQVLAPAGFKVSLCNVQIRHGILMLVPEVLRVIGGLVEDLELARERVVKEIQKPPRGKRTQHVPSLSERAFLAAWPSNITNNVVETNATSHGVYPAANPQGLSTPAIDAQRVSVPEFSHIQNRTNVEESAPPIVNNNSSAPSIRGTMSENLAFPHVIETNMVVSSVPYSGSMAGNLPGQSNAWSFNCNSSAQFTGRNASAERDTHVQEPFISRSALEDTDVGISRPASGNNMVESCLPYSGSVSGNAERDTHVQEPFISRSALEDTDVGISRPASGNNMVESCLPYSGSVSGNAERDTHVQEPFISRSALEDTDVGISRPASGNNMVESCLPYSGSVSGNVSVPSTAASSDGNSSTPLAGRIDSADYNATIQEPSASRGNSLDEINVGSGGSVTEPTASLGSVSQNTNISGQREPFAILRGDDEIPFTYWLSLMGKFRLDNVHLVQGYIKCCVTAVKEFQFKDRNTFELRVFVDDGSVIIEVLVDHHFVQKTIGHSPKAVTDALASLDKKRASDMKETMKKFQMFLANFEGIMLIEINSNQPVQTVAREMRQGCSESDGWLLLKRLRTLTSNSTQCPPSVINLSP